MLYNCFDNKINALGIICNFLLTAITIEIERRWVPILGLLNIQGDLL